MVLASSRSDVETFANALAVAFAAKDAARPATKTPPCRGLLGATETKTRAASRGTAAKSSAASWRTAPPSRARTCARIEASTVVP